MNIHQVILQPLISEKGLKDQDKGKYSFVVNLLAGKNQIKKAVETIYKVKVASLWTKIRAGKTRRTGKQRLPKKYSDVKIAIVQLAVGHKIDIMPAKEK